MDETWLALLVAALGGYLIGSIPFGVIAARLGGVGDIRKVGSGNIGATNVLRTGRKDLALLTLIGDGGKGAVAVGLAALWPDGGPTLMAVAGGAAFLGHLFPVWLGFKGGKGVATFFGTLLAAAWPVGLLAGAIWIAFAALFRLSSLSALAAAAAAPLLAFLTDRPRPMLYLALFMAALIYLRHVPNIRRLLAGTEPKIGAGKSAAAPPPEPEPGA